MIKEKLQNHSGYYMAFVGVSLLGLMLIVFSNGDRRTQMFAVLVFTVFYVVFAILHHIHDHDLNAKIMIEYALFGSLGLALTIFALFYN